MIIANAIRTIRTTTRFTNLMELTTIIDNLMKDIRKEHLGISKLSVKTESVLDKEGYKPLGEYMIKVDGCGNLMSVYRRRGLLAVFYSHDKLEEEYYNWLSEQRRLIPTNTMGNDGQVEMSD